MTSDEAKTALALLRLVADGEGHAGHASMLASAMEPEGPLPTSAC